MTNLVSPDVALHLMKSGIPDAEWLLGQIESEQGWFRFPSYFSNLITHLRIEGYPALYASEGAMAMAFLRAYMSDEEAQTFMVSVETASIEIRDKLVLDLCESLKHGTEHIQIPKTPAQQAEAKRLFDLLPAEEQAESVRVMQIFFRFFFTSFYQTLSIMVHGERLTSLVAQAKAGNDDAFVKAVQIDKRILVADPYFSERFARSQMEPQSEFYDALSYRLRTAPYRGKIRHKTLWLAFSTLDRFGLLDTLKYREILEICDEAGVGGYENRIQSEKHLGNRLNEYRKFQKRGILITT